MTLPGFGPDPEEQQPGFAEGVLGFLGAAGGENTRQSIGSRDGFFGGVTGFLSGALSAGANTADAMAIMSSAGDVMDLYSAVTGHDPRFDTDLSWWERLLGALPGFTTVAPAAMVPITWRLRRHLEQMERADDLARVVKRSRTSGGFVIPGVRDADLPVPGIPAQVFRPDRHGIPRLIEDSPMRLGGGDYSFTGRDLVNEDSPSMYDVFHESLGIDEVDGMEFTGNARDMADWLRQRNRLEPADPVARSRTSTLAVRIGHGMVPFIRGFASQDPSLAALNDEALALIGARTTLRKVQRGVERGLFAHDDFADFRRRYDQFVDGSLSLDDEASFVNEMSELGVTLFSEHDTLANPFRHRQHQFFRGDDGNLHRSGEYSYASITPNSKKDFVDAIDQLAPLFARSALKALLTLPEYEKIMGATPVESLRRSIRDLLNGGFWYSELNERMLGALANPVVGPHRFADPNMGVKQAAMAGAAASPRSNWIQSNQPTMFNLLHGVDPDVVDTPEFRRLHGQKAKQKPTPMVNKVVRRPTGNKDDTISFAEALKEAYLDKGLPIPKDLTRAFIPPEVGKVVDASIAMQEQWLSMARAFKRGEVIDRPRLHPQRYVEDFYSSVDPEDPELFMDDLIATVAKIEAPKGATPRMQKLMDAVNEKVAEHTAPTRSGLVLRVGKDDVDLTKAKTVGVQWGKDGALGNMRRHLTWKLSRKPMEQDGVFAYVWSTEDDVFEDWDPVSELNVAQGWDGDRWKVVVGDREYYLDLAAGDKDFSGDKTRNFSVAIYDPTNPNAWTQDVHANTSYQGFLPGKSDELYTKNPFSEKSVAYRKLKRVGHKLAIMIGYRNQQVNGKALNASAAQAIIWTPVQSMRLFLKRMEDLQSGKIKSLSGQSLQAGEGFDLAVLQALTGGVDPLLRSHLEMYTARTLSEGRGLPWLTRHHATIDRTSEQLSSSFLYEQPMNGGEWAIYGPDTDFHRLSLSGLTPVTTRPIGKTTDGVPIYQWVPQHARLVESVAANRPRDLNRFGAVTEYPALHQVPGRGIGKATIRISSEDGIGSHDLVAWLEAQVPTKGGPKDRYVFPLAEDTPTRWSVDMGTDGESHSFGRRVAPPDAEPEVRSYMDEVGVDPEVADAVVWTMVTEPAARRSGVVLDVPKKVATVWASRPDDFVDAYDAAASGLASPQWYHQLNPGLELIDQEAVTRRVQDIVITLHDPLVAEEMLQVLTTPVKKLGGMRPGEFFTKQPVLDWAYYPVNPTVLSRGENFGLRRMAEAVTAEPAGGRASVVYTEMGDALEGNQRIVFVPEDRATYLERARGRVNTTTMSVGPAGVRWENEAVMPAGFLEFVAERLGAETVTVAESGAGLNDPTKLKLRVDGKLTTPDVIGVITGSGVPKVVAGPEELVMEYHRTFAGPESLVMLYNRGTPSTTTPLTEAAFVAESTLVRLGATPERVGAMPVVEL